MNKRKKKDAPALAVSVYKPEPVPQLCEPSKIAYDKVCRPSPWRVVWQSSAPGRKIAGNGRYIIIAANGRRISGHAAMLRIVEAVNSHEHASVNN